MGLIRTDRLCPRCGIHHLKDYSISGDYNRDGRLQSFCPLCGAMHPPISVDSFRFTLSKRKRHNVGTFYANKHDLPYQDIHQITSDLKTVGDDEFVELFICIINREFDIVPSRSEIINYLEGSGKKENNEKVKNK